MANKKSNATQIITEKRTAKPSTSFDQNKELQKKATAKSHSPEVEAKRSATKAIKKELNTRVKSQAMDLIRDAMIVRPSPNKKSWLERFISNYMAEAESDPNSRAAQLLASNIFSSNLLSELDAERAKMMAQDISYARYKLTTTLFDKQIEVLNNKTNQKLCVICGRRSGKTEMNAREFVDACLEPNTPCCYIHLSRGNAIEQLFDLVVSCAEITGLEIINGKDFKGSKNDGLIQFANGSFVKFCGNHSSDEREKIRGGKYKLAIVDECQSQKALKYLVETIIGPLQEDYKDHQLILTGTPPKIPHTYFEKCFYNKKEYKNYHWDMRDNPFMPNPIQSIEKICLEKGLTMDSPLIRREYLGEFAYDTEALLFKDMQKYDSLPNSFIPDRVYIGVDFGFSDYNAVISLACNLSQRQCYVIRESKFNKAKVSDIIADVRTAYNEALSLCTQRNPNAEIPGCVAIYCDTNEQSISYELATTYGLPTWNAYKYNKMLALEQLAEYGRTGRLLIKADGPLAEESEQVIKKRDEDTDAILNELDDDAFHPDAYMALLYAFRQCSYDLGEDLGGESEQLNRTDI